MQNQKINVIEYRNMKNITAQKGEGRKTQQSKIKERVEEAGFSFRIFELKTDDFVKEIEEWISENEKPAATIRWDEHGNVFADFKGSGTSLGGGIKIQ